MLDDIDRAILRSLDGDDPHQARLLSFAELWARVYVPESELRGRLLKLCRSWYVGHFCLPMRGSLDFYYLTPAGRRHLDAGGLS